MRQEDGEGYVTVQSFDGLDRVVEQTLPEERTVERIYDVAGNSLIGTDARGHQTRHTFDTLNRRVRTTDPQPFAYQTTTRYDAVGNAIQVVDRRGNVYDYS